MNDFKTNFLVTIVFDKDSDIVKQTKIEFSFKNEIIKELQHLVKGKEIKHFIVADDEVINNKLKEEPKTGRWIKTGDILTDNKGHIIHQVICSECSGIAYFRSGCGKYIGATVCPNCGIKMEGEE